VQELHIIGTDSPGPYVHRARQSANEQLLQHGLTLELRADSFRNLTEI
jgi:hypothetical protein